MKKKILILDDSATARALFKACIADHPDYEVLETSSWKEALRLADEEKPVLIVLDYNMPEKLGTEIASMLIDRGVDAKFVLMSANTQPSVIDETKELGFVSVLEKPISAESVQSMLERVL